MRIVQIGLSVYKQKASLNRYNEPSQLSFSALADKIKPSCMTV